MPVVDLGEVVDDELSMRATPEERVTKWKAFWDEGVMKYEPLVLVEFSSWYPACKEIGILHKQLSEKPEFAHVKFLRIDVEDCDLLVANGLDASTLQDLGLKTLVYPTFRFFKNGKIVGEVIGAKPQELTSQLTQLASE